MTEKAFYGSVKPYISVLLLHILSFLIIAKLRFFSDFITFPLKNKILIAVILYCICLQVWMAYYNDCWLLN
ncbi:hypothetical protein BACFIN_07781 [Bacteroides finegoldii DSM 17565]|nr:hypothetical protein BACFIN_07781 [Bacteroides finegoldii DSM 17565]